MSCCCGHFWRTSVLLLLAVTTLNVSHAQQRSRESGSHRRNISPESQSQQRSKIPPRPTPRHPVIIDRELIITELAVIEDPILTNPDCGPLGVWSFKYLIEQMAGDRDPGSFALSLFTHGDSNQINGFSVPNRPAVIEKIITPWRARSGEQLDLASAPVKLLAIVNRIDLRHVTDNDVAHAGEGRFVFGVVDETGKPLAPIGGTAVGGMTIILEYSLPAKSTTDLMRWAADWHELGRYRPGTWDYNCRLAMLTKRFTDRGRGKGRPNDSALNQIRTNEIALANPWELREWVIDEQSGLLKAQQVAETPDFLTMNNTADLTELLTANADKILSGQFSLSSQLEAGSAPAGPFFDLRPSLPIETFDRNLTAAEATVAAGAMNDDFLNSLLPFYLSGPKVNPIPGTDIVANVPWQTPTAIDSEVRHRFALNTCSGCHRDETGVSFLHIGFPESSRDRDVMSNGLGAPAFLSSFLTGSDSVPDPIDAKVVHSFNDLARRQVDLQSLIDSGPARVHLTNRRH